MSAVGIRGRMRGSAMVELALCLPVFLALTIGTMGLALACWERADVDHSLSNLASELPGGWEDMDEGDLVASLVLSGSSLDPTRLSVDGASVRVVTLREVDPSSGLAQRLGGSFSLREDSWVEVSADVSYDLSNPLDWYGLLGGCSRHVERRYLASTRTEVG